MPHGVAWKKKKAGYKKDTKVQKKIIGLFALFFQGPWILKIYRGIQWGQGLIGNLQSLETTNEMKTGFLIPQNKTYWIMTTDTFSALLEMI